MANETFLTIAIAIVVSVAIGLFLGSCYNKFKSKKENGEEIDITMSKIMNIIGDITIKIYNIYADLGGIKADDYETDQQYRAKIISETISHIIKICKDYGIEVNLEQQILEGLACTVIERIINTYTIQEQQAKINELTAKVLSLEETKTTNEVAAESNENELINEEITVAFGDFYK